MFGTLNMGIGLVLIVAPSNVREIEKRLPKVYPIGVIEEGRKGIRFA